MVLRSWAVCTIALAYGVSAGSGFGKITDLVTFGDSYTDEGRLGYFIAHKGEAPPVGYEFPPSNSTSTGSYIWPRLVAQSTGIKLHDYAVSGAVCSNKLTPRYCSCIPGLFPSVQEYEIPAFLADFHLKGVSARPKLDPDNTLASIWIGTNDLGNGGLLTDEQQPDVTLVDITDCAVDAIQKLYDAGVRNFIFQNAAPLELAPQYATPERDGVTGNNHYFPTKDQFLGGNRTAIASLMREMVRTANQIWKYQLPSLADKLKDANIAYFDSYSLLLDVIQHPKDYLTAPYNTTGYEWHCTAPGCASSAFYDPQHMDGYVWYDELHPSERTDVIIAREFAKTIKKQSKYATYYF